MNTRELADEFIETLKERAYGARGASNESEGDYGSWVDWRNALIEFHSETPKENDPPVEIVDLLIFMCNTWDVIDRFVYEHVDMESDAILHYPVIQGTANQLALSRIGKLPYDKTALRKAIECMKKFADTKVDSKQ
jgi:hypothetical protein